MYFGNLKGQQKILLKFDIAQLNLSVEKRTRNFYGIKELEGISNQKMTNDNAVKKNKTKTVKLNALLKKLFLGIIEGTELH